MPPARTQAHRTLAIHTPAGVNKLFLLSMSGSESLGSLFQYELDMFAEKEAVDPNTIVGKNVTVRLEMYNDSTRYFNGFISKFSLVGIREDRDGKRLFCYRATMVPWTWFLTRYADCRIFQEKTVPNIIHKVLKDRGISEFELNLTGNYRTWEYCVQYRETDFNFISRLMEAEGIYYYFKHQDGKHTMVFCEGPSNHSPAVNYDELHFDEPDLRSENDNFVWDWVWGQEVTSNHYALDDFDPLNPRANLAKSVNVTHSHDAGTMEIFDYPGGYVTADEGRTYVKSRMEEVESQYIIAHGMSSARGIFAGATFKLEDHPACAAEDYLITAVRYQMQNDDMGTGLGSPGGAAYRAEITAIPNSYPYRPARITPKPIVQGPQTAIVVGKANEEIWTDKHGRAKVKFHWDRDPEINEKSSCWIRVSQNWAGKKYGIIFLPRVGQEVIVDFLEGDPDRPIITGRVYNGDNPPPYDLPTNATRTTIKTNSSKTGNGFNEIRFEDKKDSEQIFIHGQKDLEIKVINDRKENIDHDRHLVVKNDKFEHVKNKRHEVVDVDHMEKIGGSRHLKVGGKDIVEIDGKKSLKVGGDVAEKFEANHSEETAKDYYLKASNIILEAATNITIKVGGTSIAIESSGITVTCAGKIEFTSQQDTNITAGSSFKLAAAQNAEIQAGAKFAAQAGGQASLQASGMLQIQTSAILTIQGSMVKIN